MIAVSIIAFFGGMIEMESEVFDTHKYLSSLKKMKDETFTKYFEEYQDKYSI